MFSDRTRASLVESGSWLFDLVNGCNVTMSRLRWHLPYSPVSVLSSYPFGLALQAMQAVVAAKDEQLARLSHHPNANGGETSPSRTVGRGSKQAAHLAPAPDPAHVVPETASMQAPIGTLSPSSGTPTSAPASGLSPPHRIGANLSDPVVVPPTQQAMPNASIQPKAAPRGWGKVESPPAIHDESLPSLADALAAPKSKRAGRK